MSNNYPVIYEALQQWKAMHLEIRTAEEYFHYHAICYWEYESFSSIACGDNSHTCFSLSHTWPCLHCKESGWYWSKDAGFVLVYQHLMHNFVFIFLFRGLIGIVLIYNSKTACFSYNGPLCSISFVFLKKLFVFPPVFSPCAHSVLIGERAEGFWWAVW